MESGMNKSMAVLAVLMAGQFSLAHATHEVKSVAVTDELDVPRSSFMLTDDPSQFEDVIRSDLLTHVDFSSVAEQTLPFTAQDDGRILEGTTMAGDGDTVIVRRTLNDLQSPQALTSYQGLPATYWFGDQAEAAFVLANGSVQILFPQDVYAASLMIDAGAYNQKLQRELETISDIKAETALIDANGNMIGNVEPTTMTDLARGNPAFLGILSDIPFRSVIISSTAETWMFSDLNYVADEVQYVVNEVTSNPNGFDAANFCETENVAEQCGTERPSALGRAEKNDLPCAGVEGACMGAEM
jgi:hypothetical protein